MNHIITASLLTTLVSFASFAAEQEPTALITCETTGAKTAEAFWHTYNSNPKLQSKVSSAIEPFWKSKKDGPELAELTKIQDATKGQSPWAALKIGQIAANDPSVPPIVSRYYLSKAAALSRIMLEVAELEFRKNALVEQQQSIDIKRAMDAHEAALLTDVLNKIKNNESSSSSGSAE